MQPNLNNILQLPSKTLLERRLTKAFFLKNFSLSATEKKVLNNSITAMQWLASIKPSTANIKATISPQYSYEEIQVFTATIKNTDFEIKYKAVAELIQKHIPYQVLLIIQSTDYLVYVATDKRINQADKNKRTIENYYYTSIINALFQRSIENSFYQAISFKALDKSNMQSTYQSYIKAIVEYNTANITGQYISKSRSQTKADDAILKQIEQLENEIISLTNQIKKASMFNRKTELNIDLQEKKGIIKLLHTKLTQQ